MPALTLRTGEHPAFDRVVFDAPRGFGYRVKRDGSQVTILFEKAARLTLPSVTLSRARSFAIVAGGDGAAPLAVRFWVAPQARLTDFLSGSSIVIDITGAAAPGAAAPVAAAPGAVAPGAAAPEKSEPQRTEVKQEKEKTENNTKATAASVEPKSPAPSAAPAEKVEVRPTEQPKAAEPLPQVPSVPPDPATVAPAPKASPLAPVQPALPPVAPERSVLPGVTPQMAAALGVMANEKTPAPVLTLDPKMAVGAAIYQRAGYVTILFDRKLAAQPLLDVPGQRVKAEIFDLPHNTGLRFAVPDTIEIRTTRTGTAWQIYVVPAGATPGVSTAFSAQPDFALGARLLVPTANPPEPIYMTDPVVGDTLLVLPLRETAAFTQERRFVDFEVVPAAQGLVLKPFHEKVVARDVPDGIELTAEGGLKLSPSQDLGFSQDEDISAKRLFDLARWRGDRGDSFTETRQKLMQTVVDVPEKDKLLARLDLARFYFANGMGAESVGLLNFIAKSLPEIEKQPDFLALRGAARLLAGQTAAGLADLSAPALADQPEVFLWQAFGAAQARDWETATARFRQVFPLLAAYVEPFRSRFMILAVESALASGQDKEAAAWLGTLERASPPANARSAILYLRGVLLSKSGRTDQAEKKWREVARGRDRLYKIRAELALVDLGIATKSITPKQAVDRLEGLRFAWRGDDLEFDILRRLGGFYIDARDFRTGLLVMGQALRLYPDSPEAPILRAEMVRLFRDLFLTKMGTSLSPLEALSLYNGFRNLIPDGPEGNKVRRALAERLVDVDLLDQASDLLGEIAKNGATPEERVRTATRLAAVRLLDHRAKEALAALDQSQAEAAQMGAAVQEERQLLRARALSEDGKYDEAIAALPSGDVPSVRLLHADIAMRGKHWEDAAKALLALVGPPEAGQTLSEEKAGWLIQAALAWARAGNTAELDQLAKLYGPWVAGTSRADVFTLLTRPEKATQMKDLAAVQSRLSEVDMFKGFLDSYRKEEEK